LAALTLMLLSLLNHTIQRLLRWQH
jgi:hypothetical protein